MQLRTARRIQSTAPESGWAAPECRWRRCCQWRRSSTCSATKKKGVKIFMRPPLMALDLCLLYPCLFLPASSSKRRRATERCPAWRADPAPPAALSRGDSNSNCRRNSCGETAALAIKLYGHTMQTKWPPVPTSDREPNARRA
jgi:hypothetical protein